MDFKTKIRNIPDFPNPGILFRDITPLLQDPASFKGAVDGLAELLGDMEFDTVVGPESRGFILGAPVAYLMGKSFVPVRKAGKLPYKTRRAQYALEYGTAEVEIHVDAIRPGSRAVIVDDLLATGGTARAICRLIEESGGSVAALVFLIELEGLKGRDELAGYEIKTLVHY